MPWEIVHKVKENMRPWCTCPKCGEFIFSLSERKDYKYCPYCGEKVTKEN